MAFKVKQLRLKHQFSYQQLSDATGLSTSYLSDIEKGKRYPKPDKINSLARALDVDYDYLVSTSAPKKLSPIIDLLDSNFLKLFPLEDFGISMEKALELFAQTPDQINAFISTFFKIGRNYQITDREFYLEALRSYQDMHNNHFPDLDDAVAAFKQEFSITKAPPYSVEFLADQLEEIYDIQVDYDSLSKNKKLSGLKSFYSPSKQTLYIKDGLTTEQQRFLIGRELAFQYLKLKERPYETSIVNIESFELLHNNYKASHFSAVLLMDTQDLVDDVNEFSRHSTWSPDLLLNLLDKYQVTGEMFFQRLTNILPHYFDLEDLFFIKLIINRKKDVLSMSKNLHLSQLHSPYNNLLSEHFCRRWVASRSTLMVLDKDHPDMLVDIQISDFHLTDNTYLCFSYAEKLDNNTAKSITIGLLVNDKLRSIFHFLNDPKIVRKTVSTTCERCSVEDCDVRASEPVVIKEQIRRKETLEEMNRLK